MTVIADAARWYTMVGALWLTFLMLRVTYMRVKRDGWTGPTLPHPATALGIVMLLLVLISGRMEDLGEPGDWTTALRAVAVTLIGYGLLQCVTVTLIPPFLHHGHDST